MNSKFVLKSLKLNAILNGGKAFLCCLVKEAASHRAGLYTCAIDAASNPLNIFITHSLVGILDVDF